jgi:actin-related protein 10
MYNLVHTTPLAGQRLNEHIRNLLLLFGSYYPPLTSLSGAVNVQNNPRVTHVPHEILTEEVIEEIKTRCCFVGDPLDIDREQMFSMSSSAGTSGTDSEYDDRGSSVPPSSEMGESELGDRGIDPRISALYGVYEEKSTATELHMSVTPPESQQTGTGMGKLVIPGWIRERATEVLFDGGDVDEKSIVECVLEVLRKVCLRSSSMRRKFNCGISGTPGSPS